ncbi:hypothetical protein EPN42_01485 [bacterium]|nr:MAG: hypothetical protein EPN42_01485 [bacterium]
MSVIKPGYAIGASAVTEALNDGDAHGEMRQIYRRTLGPIEALLKEPDVVEVARLPDRDGLIKVRRISERGQSESVTEHRQNETDAQRLAQRIAHSTERSFTAERPELRTTMPVYGYRFTALMPPLTRGIYWTIRRRVVIKTTLEEYVAKGQLTNDLYRKIIAAIRGNARFGIVGPQSTGKTVLATAILRATATIYPATFFLIAEDAWEIELDHPLVLYISILDEWGLGREIPTILRTGALSVSIGEVTSGADALVEAWMTGVKRTSVLTIHGDAPENAYLRLEQLQHKEGKPVIRIANQKAVTHVLLMDNSGPEGLPRVVGLYRPTHYDESGYFLAEV